jgi:hypothetical protein
LNEAFFAGKPALIWLEKHALNADSGNLEAELIVREQDRRIGQVDINTERKIVIIK